MPAKDLGSKHTCFKCSTKFYDLRKPVAICPKCGADQRESPSLKSPSEKRSRAAKPVEPVVPEVDEEQEIAEDLDDEDEDEDDDDA